MDFKLSADQETLRGDLRKALSQLPAAAFAEDAPAGAAPVLGNVLKPVSFDAQGLAYFRSLVEKTWQPSHDTGDGRLLRAALACEEAGRHPLDQSVRSMFLASWLARELGKKAEVLSVVDRLAVSVPSDRTQIGAGPTASKSGSQWHLAGGLELVEGVMAATHLLFCATTADADLGVFVVALNGPGVDRAPVRYIDKARPAGSVRFDRATATRIDSGISDSQLADIELLGRLLTAAELVGVAAALLDHVCDFVRQRQQFGRPIGDFQAVAHRCAEMYCDVELMRSLVYAAAGSHRGNGIPTASAAAEAKALAAQLAGTVADTALHLFGAEGLRWHRGLHLLMRRVKALQVLFGGQAECEQAITDHLFRRNTERAKGA